MFKEGVLKTYGLFESGIVLVLLALLMLMVLYATGVLAVEIFLTFADRLSGLPSDPEVSREFFRGFSVLHDVYGAFMLILIGIELTKTITLYLEHHVFHVEVVFTVAMIAVARHAIDIDLANLDATSMVGMGVLLIALTGGYYLFRRAATDYPIVQDHAAGTSGPTTGA